MAGYVSLQDVTKTYKMGEVTIKAADGISFDVEKGEFVIVVGPSGAGKTTVLNILGGMDTATSGKVLVDGAEISKYRGKKLIQYRREDIGFVFQFYNLMQNLTALENVELAMQICKHPLDASELCLTPNLCSSSITTSPRLGKFISSDTILCVPIRISTKPFLASFIISLCCLAVLNLLKTSTLIG